MRSKRPCSICRKWFLPDARVKDRQRACSSPQCQSVRRKKTQAAWRGAHPGYFIAYRIQQRAAASADNSPSTPAPDASRSTSADARPPPPAPLRMPPPLDQLPWDLAKDEFGAQGADFIAVLGRVLLSATKTESQPAKDVMPPQEAAMT